MAEKESNAPRGNDKNRVFYTKVWGYDGEAAEKLK